MLTRGNTIRPRFLAGIGAVLLCSVPPAGGRTDRLKGVLVTAADATAARLEEFRQGGTNSVAILLSEDQPAGAIRVAARQIRSFGFALYYWIEIGRNPIIADAHPEWMASLQGHPEWRRFFPAFPKPGRDEVVKNYPWVPVFYRKAFEAHLERLRKLLRGVEIPSGIFLNDLQGAPSACGCGNILCRWTADYGPIRTATALGPDAAFRFVLAAKQLLPQAQVIPVWTTECEEADREESCAGVGCFAGACWREFTTQLMPFARQSVAIAALLPYRALGRDLSRYAKPAGWVAEALGSFREMPLRREGQAVPPHRLIAVLQGWDVTPEQQKLQIRRAEEAGAGGFVLALTPINQSWEPRIIKIP